jgi:hypothetical protein
MTDIKDVLEERAGTHGDFIDVAEVAQQLKQTMRSAAPYTRPHSDLLNTHAEALDMIASKIARILVGDQYEPDHWLDIEGYARLARERINTDG